MKYLYYKLYQFQKWVGTESQPEIPSFILLSIIQTFYLSDLLFLINYFIIPFRPERITLIGLCILLVFFNHFYLYKKRNIIFSNYQSESKARSMLGFVLALVFVIFAFILTFIFIHYFGYWKQFIPVLPDISILPPGRIYPSLNEKMVMLVCWDLQSQPSVL